MRLALRRPRGVRARLLLAIIGSVGAALALMTAGFNLLLARSLSNDANNVLRSRAAAEIAALEVKDGRLVTPEYADKAGLESQSWLFVGRESVESPRVDTSLNQAAASTLATAEVPVDVPARHTRLYAEPVIRSGKTLGTVVAGVSLAPYDATRRIALVGSLLFAGGLLLVVALVARWMLAAALRPIAGMTADAERWSVDDPDRRFAAGEPHDELSQLAATLDGLLDRLAASLRREQRFSAEISHELRTPLAKVCAEADLALRREREPGAYKDALQGILHNAQQMTRAVETLVAASRQEAGLARGRSDARVVIEAVAETCEALAAERGIELDLGDRRPGPFVGVDADIAMRILQPLVENACQHAAGAVRLTARHTGTRVLFTVEDDGPGIALDERERIFAPGVRGSADRGDGPLGAGLGLALARRLARAAAGDVEALDSAQGARFVVRLPSG